MFKVSDYIASRFSEFGVEQVFMITGGGAMHLNDSFSHQKGMKVLYTHHEQACAIAAEGYHRATGKVAVVNVTTGPGGLNSLTGVHGQWTDSVPVIYVSGQVKFETTISSCRELGLRQLGDQEVDIVSVVLPLVKYAARVERLEDVRLCVEKAWHIAREGRPGPVWLDVPMNIQGAPMDPGTQRPYEPSADRALNASAGGHAAEATLAADAMARLAAARRPVIVAGHGIRIAGARAEFERFIAETGIPVVGTFNGFDLLPQGHPNFVGRIGTLGSRAGNFALQNADVVLILGSRNNIRQASYNWPNFAHRAFRIIVDIDPAELAKPTVKPDLAIRADIRSFLRAALAAPAAPAASAKPRADWLAWCMERKNRYPILQEKHLDDSKGLSPYLFFDHFTRGAPAGSIGVAGNGTACVCLFQAGIVNEGTRWFWNSGCASMGFDLPAAMGAAAGSGTPVYCFAGDGSLQMNIQELQTIASNRLPVKLLYLNNGGYASIKQTQDAFFRRRAGCDPASGVSFPDMRRIADAYGIPYVEARRAADCANLAERLNAIEGPVVCEVFLQTEYIFEPKLSSEKLADGTMVSKPLEDLYPFLPRDEFAANMIVD